MKTPNRRFFLRSAGVAIAVPMFDSLLSRGEAATTAERPVKRMVCLSNNYGVYQKAFFPEKPGRDYELPPTLLPLKKHREDFTVF